jgi:aminoglycoside phosphotransferase (APT) family kinase protein
VLFQFKHLNRLIKSAFIAEVKASRITTLDALNAAFLARADTDYNKRIHSETGEGLVQNHGDFHPKNIIIGQDRGQDISTVFVSVIDFANTILFSPAFDVGYFVAQLRYQLREHPEVLERPSASSRATSPVATRPGCRGVLTTSCASSRPGPT